MYVSSGGTADNTTVNRNGRLYVSSGGSADHTTVNYDGYLTVSSGGTASIAFNPWRGTVISEGDAVVTYLDRDADVYFGGNAYGLVSKSSAFSNLSIGSGYSALVYSRGFTWVLHSCAETFVFVPKPRNNL